MAVIQTRVIRSKRRAKGITEREFKRIVVAELKSFGKGVKRELDGVVSDWSSKNRPKFTVKIQTRPDEIIVAVAPRKRSKASQIFKYVDEGTKPHVIKPKPNNKKGLLFFRTGYSPRTLPVARAHVGSGTSSGPLVAARSVNHPGTKARLFTKTITNESRPDFRRRMENAMRRAQRKLK